jgi:hypothetical protein
MWEHAEREGEPVCRVRLEQLWQVQQTLRDALHRRGWRELEPRDRGRARAAVPRLLVGIGFVPPPPGVVLSAAEPFALSRRMLAVSPVAGLVGSVPGMIWPREDEECVP